MAAPDHNGAWTVLTVATALVAISAVAAQPALYVGGAFMVPIDQLKGGVLLPTSNLSETAAQTMNNVGRWNGSAWSALSVGLNSDPRCFTQWQGTIVAGGYFTSAGGLPVSHVAYWDGTSWWPVGKNLKDNIFALTSYGPNQTLCVGGIFDRIDGIEVNSLACWDGATWRPVGENTPFYWVYALADWDGKLVAGGAHVAAIHIWDGRSWTPLGGGLTGGVVRALATAVTSNEGHHQSAKDLHSDTVLYAGGDFNQTILPNSVVLRIARWDGLHWEPLGGGVDSMVNAIAVAHDNSVYAGGLFIRADAGAVTVNRVARWDGRQWSALGAGVDGAVFGIAIMGNDVYVCGPFQTAGGLAIPNLAKWDGSRWEPVSIGGQGFDGSLYTLLVADIPYKPGFPTAAPTTTMPPGNAVIPAATIIGGCFATVNNTAIARIARWSGADLDQLDVGPTNDVYAMAVFPSPHSNEGDAPPSRLLVAGAFGMVGRDHVAVDYLAWWDGATWSPVASIGPDRAVFAVQGLSGGLCAGSEEICIAVGGQFSTAGGVSAMKVVEWRGVNSRTSTEGEWLPLGAGVNDDVLALCQFGDLLCAGGYFTLAGVSSFDTVVNHVACWDGRSWNALTTGVDAQVYALAAFGDSLIVGGAFESAGGARYYDGLARWQLGRWLTLSPTVEGEVYALAVVGTRLYIGGSFYCPPLRASHLLQWDGFGTLEAVPGWVYQSNGEVRALTAHNGTVCAAGYFSSNDWFETYVAACLELEPQSSKFGQSSSRWIGVTGDQPAYAIVSAAIKHTPPAQHTPPFPPDTHLYAAGDFGQRSDGQPVNNVFRWDGIRWAAVGDSGWPAAIHAMTIFDGRIIVASDRTPYGLPDIPSDICMGQWDGETWMPFENIPYYGWDGSAYALVSGVMWAPGGKIITESALCVGGSFLAMNGVAANGIACWTGSGGWQSLNNGLQDSYGYNAVVYALLVDPMDPKVLYVGGDFTYAFDMETNDWTIVTVSVARWDGEQWRAMGNGLGNSGSSSTVAVYALHFHADGFLYASGQFPELRVDDWSATPNVARWDGATWSVLRPLVYMSAVDGAAYAMASLGPTLHMVGSFAFKESPFQDGEFRRGRSWRRAVLWDGRDWAEVGPRWPDSVRFRALASTTTHLFAAGSGLAEGVVAWNGSTWTPVDSNESAALNGAIYALLTVAASFQPRPSPKLSNSATIAVAVSVSVAVLFVIGLSYWCWKSRQARKLDPAQSAKAVATYMALDHGDVSDKSMTPMEVLPGQTAFGAAVEPQRALGRPVEILKLLLSMQMMPQSDTSATGALLASTEEPTKMYITDVEQRALVGARSLLDKQPPLFREAVAILQAVEVPAERDAVAGLWWAAVGDLTLAVGATNEAKMAYQTCLPLLKFAEVGMRVHLQLGLMAFQMHQLDDALAHLRSAITMTSSLDVEGCLEATSLFAFAHPPYEQAEGYVTYLKCNISPPMGGWAFEIKPMHLGDRGLDNFLRAAEVALDRKDTIIREWWLPARPTPSLSRTMAPDGSLSALTMSSAPLHLVLTEKKSELKIWAQVANTDTAVLVFSTKGCDDPENETSFEYDGARFILQRDSSSSVVAMLGRTRFSLYYERRSCQRAYLWCGVFLGGTRLGQTGAPYTPINVPKSTLRLRRTATFAIHLGLILLAVPVFIGLRYIFMSFALSTYVALIVGGLVGFTVAVGLEKLLALYVRSKIYLGYRVPAKLIYDADPLYDAAQEPSPSIVRDMLPANPAASATSELV